jgi:glycerate dehydrogenase
MKIVVLDGYTLNPGDLSWKPLENLCECKIFDRTTPDEVISRAKDAEIILTNKTVISAQFLDELPKCRYIGVLATGYNIIDLESASIRNIPVCNVPAYSTNSVAQMTFAHLLNLTHHVAHHAQTVKEDRWVNSPDFCYWDTPLVELQDKVMGIIGLGRIGTAVAGIARAFGMKVIAYDPANVEESSEYEVVKIEDLFRQADVVSLHCPLTKDNKLLINEKSISLMKKTVILINTSRGPLIDEQALANALNKGDIAAAAVDVLSVEPAQADNPLLDAKNCHITPHISWATLAARKRLLHVTVENIQAFLNGKCQNVVNEII